MKNMKKKILTISLILTMTPQIIQASGIEKVHGIDNKIQQLQESGIIQGDENGNLNLDNKITRAEITTTIINMLNRKEQAKAMQNQQGIFKDVTPEFWANGAINDASLEPLPNNQYIIKGYKNNTFRPQKDISYAELSKMLVTIKDKYLMKEDVDNYNKNWPYSWIQKAEKLGINEDTEIFDPDTKLNRKEAFTMIYNTIDTDKKSEQENSKDNKLQLTKPDINTEQINKQINDNIESAKEAKKDLMNTLNQIKEGKKTAEDFQKEMQTISQKIKLSQKDLQEIQQKIETLNKNAGKDINLGLDKLSKLEKTINDFLKTENTEKAQQNLKNLLDNIKKLEGTEK